MRSLATRRTGSLGC